MEAADVAIVGGGAAGLATAIFLARARTGGRGIVVLDGAKKLGAKILVSGGGRCNVTNVAVGAEDFFGGSPHIVKRVLGAFSAERAAAFFRELGVGLHEEEHGKLFPDSNDAQTVLQALLDEAGRLGVEIRCSRRVKEVRREGDGFAIETSGGPVAARRVVLATGGRSLAKTGSDGFGYELAKSLGHTIVPTTPALAPLTLEKAFFHSRLSGLSQEVELTVRTKEEKPVRIAGSMLWTHFGVSGPAAMNASRLWHRARLERRGVLVFANFLPGETVESTDARLIELARAQPRAQLHNALATVLPARLAHELIEGHGFSPRVQMAQLPRDDRNFLADCLARFPLPITGSRGYEFAEATAGGVPLTEIDAATMESRCCDGLHLVGEILDVDGRIGGYNFQWAWSSGYVAGRGLDTMS